MAIDNDTDVTEDLDPAAPVGGVEAPGGTEAADRTNYGADGRGDLPEGGAPEGPNPRGTPAVLSVDIGKAHAFLTACMTSHPRVGYGLGAKIKPGQIPGQDFRSVDCSGFVREAIRRSTNLGGKFPDGSVVQHDWVRNNAFQVVERSSGALADGGVRIAFLKPTDSPQRIGHVVLLHRGKTLESHGGVGPDERSWTGNGWQSKAHVYMLMPAD